ncbi:MAG: hypothetical protein MJZ36_10240 [Bacteroidaceae bacterium]|nr:hypothetical protein [Bacteroidaceae bacterium]
MKVNCEIIEVLPKIEGQKRDGSGTYHVQPVKIVWGEEGRTHDGATFIREQSLIVDIIGESARTFSLQPPAQVTMDLRFDTHEWQDKKFNKVFSSFIMLR